MKIYNKNNGKENNQKKRKKKKGFTLIELTVVLAIMAIIITVIAPNFSSVKDGAKTKVDEQNCAAIERSVEMLLAEDIIESSVKTITITPDENGITISGVSGEGEIKLQDLLGDLDKPQNGEFYNVNIENGRLVRVSTAGSESL